MLRATPFGQSFRASLNLRSPAPVTQPASRITSVAGPSRPLVFRLFVFLRLTWPLPTSHLHRNDFDAWDTLPRASKARASSCNFDLPLRNRTEPPENQRLPQLTTQVFQAQRARESAPS